MNLLYIHTHDTGRYNGIYGLADVTPNMVEFARDACVFENAHCTAPTCSPSRGSMLTGMLPHNSGLIGLTHRGFALNDPKQHLSHFLKNNGYHTVICGFQHEAEDVSTLGYQQVYRLQGDNFGEEDDYTTDSAISFLNSVKQPFFMSVGLKRPHRPYEKNIEFDINTIVTPSCLPDTKEVREDFADYLTSVKLADSCIGRVLNSLKENNLYENTMVILTTDHGIAFPLMKSTLYDTGTGVSLAIRIPNKSVARRTRALVSQIDIFPTICEALQLPKPDYLQGNSLMKVLTGESDLVHNEIFAEMNFHAMYEPARSIRTNRYKYICRFGETRRRMRNIDGGISKTQFLENGFSQLENDSEELYDLFFDPNERNNLINDPAYEKIYKELKAKLLDNMKNTEDPLLNGPIIPPDDSKLCSLD